MESQDLEKVIYNIIVVVCFLFLAILFVFQVNELYAPSSGSIRFGSDWEYSQGEKVVYLGSGEKTIFMKDRDAFPQGIYSLKNQFLFVQNIKDPTLVIPSMEGHGIKIYINYELLATFGDLVDGRSSCCHSAHIIDIPKNLLDRGLNQIEIKCYATSRLGFTVPIYIADRNRDNLKLVFLSAFSNRLIPYLVGVFFATGILLILFSVTMKNEGLDKMLIGTGIILIALSLPDLNYVDRTLFNYCLFKNIKIGESFLALSFLLAGLNIHMNRKIDILGWISIVSTFLAAVYMFTAPWDMVAHEIRFDRVFWSFSFLLVDSLWLFIKYWRRPTSLIILCGNIFCGMMIGYDATSYFSSGQSIILYPIGVIVLVFSIILLLNVDNKTYYRAFQEEKRKRVLAQYHSMIDPLTGAFNRRVFDRLNIEDYEHYSLIQIDLDHFKEVNDTFGHHWGDRVLKSLVHICNTITREEDFCIRLGGDEFLLFLPNCHEERAFAIAGELRDSIRQCSFNCDDKTLKYSCSFGICECRDGPLSESILLVDRALYRAKETRDAISV